MITTEKITVELHPNEIVGKFCKAVKSEDVMTEGNLVRVHDLVKASLTMLSAYADCGSTVEIDAIFQLMSVLQSAEELLNNKPSTPQIIREYHESRKEYELSLATCNS